MLLDNTATFRGALLYPSQVPDWPLQNLRFAKVSLTRIKDVGIAIRHSRGRILVYTAGSRNGLKGLDREGTHPKMNHFERKITKIEEANASLLPGKF